MSKPNPKSLALILMMVLLVIVGLIVFSTPPKVKAGGGMYNLTLGASCPVYDDDGTGYTIRFSYNLQYWPTLDLSQSPTTVHYLLGSGNENVLAWDPAPDSPPASPLYEGYHEFQVHIRTNDPVDWTVWLPTDPPPPASGQMSIGTADLNCTGGTTPTPIYVPSATPTSTSTPVPPLFGNYSTLPAGEWAEAVATGDFNNDGRTDIAVSSDRYTTAGSESIHIYYQGSNGQLTNHTSFSTGLRPESLAAGDFNHDGLIDLVVTSFSNNLIYIYYQQANGVMSVATTRATSTGPDSVATGDVNNDGLTDIVVSNWNSAYINVYYQYNNGTLGSAVSLPSVSAGYDDIDIGDVNCDGRMDIVKMNGQNYGNPNFSVYLQKADNTLSSPVDYDLGDINANGIAIGDVTGDRCNDIVMTYGGNRPSGMVAVWKYANGSLQSPVSYSTYDIPESVEIADVTGDGRNDVVIMQGGWYAFSVFFQNVDGTLNPNYQLFSQPYATHYQSEGLVIADLNSDGWPDVANANYNYGLVVNYHDNSAVAPTPAPTATAYPTSTPTSTPAATNTPLPTATSNKTPTPPPTFTPTSTPTKCPRNKCK